MCLEGVRYLTNQGSKSHRWLFRGSGEKVVAFGPCFHKRFDRNSTQHSALAEFNKIIFFNILYSGSDIFQHFACDIYWNPSHVFSICLLLDIWILIFDFEPFNFVKMASEKANETITEREVAKVEDQDPYGKLLDTYGNEFKLPDFTIKQIRDAIPPHCFERSGLRGFAYIARDIFLLASTFYLWYNYVTPSNVPSKTLRFVLWAIYGFTQGLFGTGIWVIAHECGHQSFSPSKTLNDITGWVLHSALLVPYFSWKISHGKHHKSTGHMERDMVFLPKTREVYAGRVRRRVEEISELTEEAPLVTALVLIGRQLIGWPMYLLQNKTGHDNHERQSEGRGAGKRNGLMGGVNHFDPSSPLYDAKDAKYIALSDLGLGLAALALYEVAQSFGWGNLLVWYFVPYLWVNHWLGSLMSSKNVLSTRINLADWVL